VVDIVNDAYGKLIDRSPEQLIGKPLFEVIPEARPYFYHIIEKVRITGESLHLYDYPYFVMVDREKKEGFLDLVYQPYQEQDGTVTGVMILCHDVTEKVLARKRIEESEARFRALVEEAPVATCLYIGRELIIEVANDIMIGYWGKGRSVIGKPLAEALPELKGQPFLEIMDEVYTTGKTYEAKAARADLVVNGILGTYYFDFTYKPLRNAAGQGYGIINMAIDVTAQVLSHKIVEESEEQLRIGIEGAQLGTYDFYPQTGKLIWSAKTKELFGLPPDAEVNYDTYLKGLHPDDKERSHAATQSAMQAQSGGLYESEYRIIGITDGKLRWVRSKGKTAFDAEGKPIRFTGITQDITAQKEAQEELAYQKQLLETVTENTKLALFMMDERQHCIYINEAAQQMTGFKTEEVQGKQLHYFIHHTHPDGRPYPLEECPIGQSAPAHKQTQGEEVFVHKDGSFYPVAFTASPIIVNGKGVGTIIEVRNTSEEKKKEQALQHTREQLELTFRNVPSAIYHFDKYGKLLYLNERGAKLMGYETVEEVLAEKDIFRLRERLDQTFLTLDEGGKHLPVEQSSAALSFRTGEPSEVVS
jgi:PAS domain S-box-containing protein